MTFHRTFACLGLLITACSGDDGSPAPARAPDAGAGGSAEASSGGAGGAVSTGGTAGKNQEAGVSGFGGSGTGGYVGTGGSATGGASTGGGPSTGGSAGVPDGGIPDTGPDAAPEAAVTNDAGDAEAAPLCSLPRVECSGACVDLSADPLHCGDCSRACGLREACINGTCTPAHCGSSLEFTVESELSILSVLADAGTVADAGGVLDGGAGADGGGGAPDGGFGDAGAVSVPNQLLLAPAGTGGTMDAWIAASDGIYRAAGTTGTAMLSSPSLVLAGASQWLSVAKLDADGLLDLVSDSPSDADLFLGGTSGGYGLAGTIALGDHAGRVLAVDIDGDQQNEIVVAALQDNLIVVSIYKVPPLNQPAFWRGASVPLGGSLDVYGLAAGNFDQDGYRDLVLAAYGSDSSSSFGAVVTLSNTPTELSDPVVHGLPEGRVRSPLVFDFNADGFDDVVAVAGRSIHFFAGSELGLPMNPATMTPETSFTYADAAAADFDRDGKLDLALVRRVPPSGTQVVLAWGDGKGAFAPDFTQAIALPSVSGIAAGDVNGDAKPDLVVISASRGSVTGVRNDCN